MNIRAERMDRLTLRRVAAHEVKSGSEVIWQAVVELMGGKVVRYYSFSGELPQTEWLGGTIIIEGDCAYWNGIRLK